MYGVGECGGVHFYVMQFIPGQSVNLIIDELRRLRRNAPAPARPPDDAGYFSAGDRSTSASGLAYHRSVARVGLQVAEALDYAHAHGVLHRDIKPSNLLLDRHGTVWITDFGLAKSEGSNDLTEAGDVVGTLNYMSPERLDGRSDPRTDVYALGATLYELLALRPPFEGPVRAKLIERILYAPPPPLRGRDGGVPRDLDTIICKALAKEPGDRYAGAREMADDLRLFLSDRTIRSRRTTALERLWRWRRRNPALAAITAALVLVFTLGFAGVTWKWRDAERARLSERLARQEADRRTAEIRLAHVRLREAGNLLDIGTQFIEGRGWDDADAAFSRAVALRPKLAAAWETRGALYHRLGLFELAAADFQRAFELYEPINHRQWRRLALLRLHVGDAAGYRAVADRMAERFRGTVHGEAAVDLIRTRALAEGGGDDPDYWVGLAEKAAGEWAQTPPWPYLLGAVDCRAGRQARAIERFLKAPDGSPTNDFCQPILCMAYWRTSQTELARRAFERAARVREQWLDRIHSAPTGLWIVDQGAKGEWPVDRVDWLEFEIYFRRAADLLGVPAPPDDARLTVQRARALAGLRRREAADREYCDAMRLRPDDPGLAREAFRNRGFLQLTRDHYPQAAEEFSRALELDRSDSDVWRYLAVSQCAAGDVSAYRRTCATMADRFADDTDRRVLLSVVLTCTLYPDAVPDVRRLLGAGEAAATWWIDSGQALVGLNYRLGRYEEALRSADRHAEYALAHPGVLLFSAMASHRLGRREEAARLLHEGIAAMTAPADLTTLRALASGSDPRDRAAKLSEQILRGEAEALILGTPPGN